MADMLERARWVLQTEIVGLETAARNLDQSFVRAVEMIRDRKGKLIVTGIGKSGIIADKIAATLCSTGTVAFTLHPVDALHGDLGMVEEGDVCLMLSYSGRSRELVDLVPFIQGRGAVVIALTSAKNNLLSQKAQIVIAIGEVAEACPLNAAPTTSTTAMLAVGDALAVALMEANGITHADFAASHPGGALGQQFRPIRDFVRPAAQLPTARLDTSMMELLDIVNKGKLGFAVIVTDNGAPAGLFTDGDLRRTVLKTPRITDFLAQDVMAYSPKTIEIGATVADALEIMERHKITTLLVTDGGKFAGAIHLHDLVEIA